MMNYSKNIIIVGYQGASMKMLFKALNFFNYDKSYKLSYFSNKSLSDKTFSSMCEKELTLKDLNKILKNKFIDSVVITGTSETYFERNLWFFFKKNNINVYAYVDSWVHVKTRLINSRLFPDKIFFQDKNSMNKVKSIFSFKSSVTNLSVIGSLQQSCSFLFQY